MAINELTTVWLDNLARILIQCFSGFNPDPLNLKFKTTNKFHVEWEWFA